MSERPSAEYAVRNAPPILEVLRREFATRSRVLEIGSGTGQHAVTFAAAMPNLHWQTSDLEENHDGIKAWIRSTGLDNVGAPVSFDVRNAMIESASYDAVFSANTAHIMSITAVEAMFTLVATGLTTDGVFCLYGPFRVAGLFNSRSNADFDVSLRHRDAAMGIRDLEQLDAFAASGGMRRTRLYAVPSNNYVAVWTKGGEA